jgi:predicted RNA-binding Zn-ribbon protein involved in translation (DUF1610 family)
MLSTTLGICGTLGQCPDCGREIPDEVYGKELHDKANVNCPFCGAELIARVDTSPQKALSLPVETPLQTMGIAGVCMGLILIISALFAASYYTEYVFGRLYPYAGYVFPLLVIGTVLLVGGIVLAASGRKR